MKIKICIIHLLSITWISLGVIVFLLSWCQPYIGIPLTICIALLNWKFYKSLDSTQFIEISKPKLLLSFAIIILIMMLAGIGGYVVQPNDHFYRNHTFSSLIRSDWPIVHAKYNGEFMCGYIAYYLVPALIGKFFSSIDIGFFAQLLWVSLGALLMFLEICINIGKVKLGALFIFYFFAGWKIIECLLYFPVFGTNTIRNTILTIAVNGSPSTFHASPMVQLLHDPFNQTIPVFVVMMLLLNNLKSRYIGFIYSLLLLYAPFPFIGLAFVVLYLMLKSTNISNIRTFIKSWMTIPNVIALCIMLICGLYLSSNKVSSAQEVKSLANPAESIYAFTLYIIFEFIIFIVLGYRACHHKAILWLLFIPVCFFGWINIGGAGHNDFCFKSNIPLIFFLTLLLIRRYYMETSSKKIKQIIIICLLIGGIPAQTHSILRYISTYFVWTGKDQSILNNYQSFYDVTQMYIMQQKKTRNDNYQPQLVSEWSKQGGRGSTDSIFYKYLLRK